LLRTASAELEEAAEPLEPVEPEPFERALEEDPPAAEPDPDSPLEELAALVLVALVVPPPETVSPT
jgi:hypothetical protein